MAARLPATWVEYARGASPAGRSDSVSSTGNQGVASEDDPLLGDHGARGRDDEFPRRRRRRSSVTNAFTALTDIGGVNSIRSFGRSFQRAAAFAEIIPQRPSFIFAPGQEPLQAGDIEAPPAHGLLRQQLGATSDSAITDTDQDDSSTLTPTDSRQGERKRLGSQNLHRVVSPSGSVRSGSIFSTPPLLSAPPLFGSYGSVRSYSTVGDLESEASHASMREAAELWRQQHESGANVPDGERPPILVKEVEQDGKIVLAVSGQSTLPQTVVNSTNLPMGLKYAGWIVGIIALVLCAAVTSWTARLLAKCMDLDSTIITFSDIAYISFGRKARVATAVLFTLELIAACVALIVLFADSLASLFPGTLSLTEFKIIYRDMRHPYKYKKAVRYTFSFTLLVDASVAIVGLLMFGDGVRDEITVNILETTGYPNVLNVLLVIFTSIIPLTKVPLNAQPIITTAEVLFGLQQQVVAEETPLVGLSSTSRGLLKALVRVVTLLVFLAIAILFPGFESIMAFMGSTLAFTICVTLPLAFYLKLFGREIATGERILCWSIMLLSSVISIVGTVWAFLPRQLIGAT
ncbi:hypothetical protein CHU98_g7292 [Xylaria longipes]|nr:hypothetical protein CHU98_g7292 [Xylaria longipes]